MLDKEDSRRSPPILTRRFWLATLVPAVVAAILVTLSVAALEVYGWAVFLLLPSAIGVMAALIYRPASKHDLGVLTSAHFLSYLVIALVISAMQVEGLVCLAMAAPLAFPLTLASSAITYVVLRDTLKNSTTITTIMLLITCVVLTAGFEASNRGDYPEHSVTTTVEIDAPIDRVWQNVIAFPEIDDKPEGILNLGFAYPVNARIDGTGVGAVRYCNFNTGAFVEPITVWDQPNRLAFDVAEQPPIMRETGLADSFDVRHLTYLRSKKGEFRLRESEGKTIIEGTTWYVHEIAPDWYWQMFSDAIIHRIHMRVLQHIQKVSESPIEHPNRTL